MTKSVKYIGTTSRWPELAVTGKQSTWEPGKIEERSDTEAAQLLGTGLFADQSALQLPDSKVAAISAVVSGDGITPHPRYWFHGFAPWQTADSGRFRDMVAGNHGVFGANLSRSQAWTALASGYVSTVDPVGGSTDPVIRIPGPNFDYNGGESLLVLWSGQVTPEGADASLMGTAHSTAQKGLRIRIGSTGRLSFVLHDTAPTSLYSTTTTDNALGKPFVSGEAHTFAVWINGSTRKTSMWVDGLINVNEFTISSAAACDTLSSNTWNIGAASPAPGGTEGIASKTHAFAGLKFLATDTLPTIEQLTAVVQAFDRAPHALIARGAL